MAGANPYAPPQASGRREGRALTGAPMLVRSAATRTAPGPPGGWLFAHLEALRTDPMRFLDRLHAEYGDVVHPHGADVHLPRLPPQQIPLHSARPRRELREAHHGLQPLAPGAGDGLVTSEGELWRRQRRIMKPAFHKERLAGFAETITTATGRLIERWAAADGPVDVNAEMMRLTLGIAGRAFFGMELSEDQALADAFSVALTYVNHYLLRVGHPPLFVPTQRTQAQRGAALPRWLGRRAHRPPQAAAARARPARHAPRSQG